MTAINSETEEEDVPSEIVEDINPVEDLKEDKEEILETDPEVASTAEKKDT
jgi:hypothetical protein